MRGVAEALDALVSGLGHGGRAAQERVVLVVGGGERRGREVEGQEPAREAVLRVIDEYLLSKVDDLSHQKLAGVWNRQGGLVLGVAAETESRVSTPLGTPILQVERESDGNVVVSTSGDCIAVS